MNFIFPKPQNEAIFEDMVCDIFSRLLANPNLQRYGRRGQNQQGLDIIGGIAGQDYFGGNLVGIQCKNHTGTVNPKKLRDELKKDLKSFDKSKIPIKKFYFITSAENDKNLKKFVLQINKNRKKDKKSIVIVQFWDFIQSEIQKYPDLLYKYFTKFLPSEKGEDVVIPDLKKKNKYTLTLVHSDLLRTKSLNDISLKLNEVVKNNLHGIERKDGYNLYIGISTKSDVNFENLVDLDINYGNLFKTEKNLTDQFKKICISLKGLAAIINKPGFTENIVLYIDAEISLAFLIGRIFRKFKFNTKIIFKNQVWSTSPEDTVYVNPEIIQEFPKVNNKKNQTAVFMLEALDRGKTDFKQRVISNIKKLRLNPGIITSFKIKGDKIKNAAQAWSVSKEIADNINQLETWGVKNIHLFIAAPKALAFLISYALNTLNSTLHLYFLNSERKLYLKSAIINNKIF